MEFNETKFRKLNEYEREAYQLFGSEAEESRILNFIEELKNPPHSPVYVDLVVAPIEDEDSYAFSIVMGSEDGSVSSEYAAVDFSSFDEALESGQDVLERLIEELSGIDIETYRQFNSEIQPTINKFRLESY